MLVHESVTTEETASKENGVKRRTTQADQTDDVETSVPSLKPSGLYFSSVTEARQVVQGLNWGPHPDDTLPQSQQEREAIVHKLLAAMQDMSVVQDKMSGLMLKKRWLGGAVVGKVKDEDGEESQNEVEQRVASDAFYQRWQKERICWEIVVSTHCPFSNYTLTPYQATAEKIYREGTGFVSVLDPVKLKDCEASRPLTFRERIDMLVRVCREY
jgi:hypothetical protein